MKTTFFRPSVSWCPIPSHVCTTGHLFPLGSLELKNAYGLSGRTYANSWDIGLFGSPLGWPALKWFRLKQQGGESFRGWFSAISSRPHSPPPPAAAPQPHAVSVNRKPCFSVEIPPVSLWGKASPFLRRKHLGRRRFLEQRESKTTSEKPCVIKTGSNFCERTEWAAWKFPQTWHWGKTNCGFLWRPLYSMCSKGKKMEKKPSRRSQRHC